MGQRLLASTDLGSVQFKPNYQETNAPLYPKQVYSHLVRMGLIFCSSWLRPLGSASPVAVDIIHSKSSFYIQYIV